jgi:hypothetical protein
MEPTHTTLQRLDQLKINKVKRVRRTLEAWEAEKDIVIECARELDVNEDAKLRKCSSPLL